MYKRMDCGVAATGIVFCQRKESISFMRQLTGGRRDTIYTSAVLMLVIIVGISFLGLGLVMPLRALYGRQIGASSTEIGLMTASFALPIIFIAPLAGRITDRYGRYWFFLLGLLVTG